MIYKKFCAASAIGLAVSFGATSVAAQDKFPERPVRMLIPFAPGGETDLFARSVSDKLGQVLGQPVIVENRPGATGIVASEFVARSKPDGYTLIFGTAATHALNVAVYKDLSYHPVRDFEPIAFVGSVPLVLYAHSSMPANLKDFVALLKANPGKYSYGAAGSSTSHLGVELFNNAVGVSAVHVPYKGSGPALQDTVGGQVQYMGASVGVGMPMVQSGRLHALGVMAKQRLAAAPNVPTVAEAGLPELEVGTWNVVTAPKGTPKPIVDRLNSALNQVLRDPEVKERLTTLGITPIADSTPESTAKTVTAEIEKWAKAAQLAGTAAK
jgi:tripartite-type tricarboxylate transporter receptor subunit TctC